MGLTIYTDNMETEEMPTGEIMARCYQVFDLGYQRVGENPCRREVAFLFELNQVRKDKKPFTITKRFTASMHPKANLRGFIESWRGRPYDDEQVKQYDLSQLIGKYAFVNIVKKTAEGRKHKDWWDIFCIRPRGDAAPFMTQMQAGYTPDWIKQAIAGQLPPPTADRGYEQADATPQNEAGPRDLPSRKQGEPNPNGGRYVPPDSRTEF